MKPLQFSHRHECRIWKRKLLHIIENLLKCRWNLNIFLFALVSFTLICGILKWLHSFEMSKNLIRYDGMEKIDWHNWSLIAEDMLRTGIGEQGEGAYLPFYPASTKQINDTHGYNGYLSDKIALNRSLKDLRPTECIHEKYSSKLPSVSVIIIFHNEHLSTLLRTCYSVLNRSPANLLAEIILVDDASTIADLGEDLALYIESSLPIAKLVRLEQRMGLIKARVAGAKAANSEIFVFLDSHCEAYHNWLPPLLDAMNGDYRTVVLPTIDVIASDTYAFRRQFHPSDFASRGVFDWAFKYQLVPLLPSTILQPTKPFETPIMAGGLFVISAQFFWELGAYDEGLNTYGGEQFELSFKIWQCGGRMLESACSRVGHIYRYRPISVNLHIKYDFVSTNYKRVAEVWMDEYKAYLYDRQPMVYNKVDAGDVSAQKALRARLQCKSFKWFMENVAFDVLERFAVEEPSFAYGGIKNLGINLCADTMSKEGSTPVGLYPCARNISYPQFTQTFSLTLSHDIRVRFEHRCWKKRQANSVWLVSCPKHQKLSDQLLWKYDLERKWIINKSNGFCLDVNGKKQLVLSRCRHTKRNQMWDFGILNHTAFQAVNNDWD